MVFFYFYLYDGIETLSDFVKSPDKNYINHIK